MSDSTKQSGLATSAGFERPRPRGSGVGDTTENKTETETTEKNKRESDSGDTELPPNENLRKSADEAYGDTEIPERKGDL
jgi:hypothetical protein